MFKIVEKRKMLAVKNTATIICWSFILQCIFGNKYCGCFFNFKKLQPSYQTKTQNRKVTERSYHIC